MTVTVLAVPCLDPQVPAGSAATLGFTVPADASRPVKPAKPAALAVAVKQRLRAIACDTELTSGSAAAVKD